MISSKALATTALAVAIGLGLSGCTTEHEITESEFNGYVYSDDPFMVDGKPFSGRLVYKEGDKVKMTIEVDDGRPDGILEGFHDNGKRAIRAEQRWDDEKREGVLDGESVEWNAEGVMVERKVAKRGVNERLERWCDNGDRRELVEYEDGNQQKREEWDCDTGNQVSAQQYDSEGRRQGEQKTWSPQGTLISHTNYVAGEQEGLQQEWHANGAPHYKGMASNGKAKGTLERWDETGKLVETGTYGADGEKTGLWLQHGYNGSTQVHYGPDGFISPAVNRTYVTALTRPDAKAVSFLLDEGQVKVGDALPASYNGDASTSNFSFPVMQWTYSVIVAAPEVLRTLVDRGGDINQADSQGTTRLLRCAEHFSAVRNHYGAPCRPDELDAIIALGGKGNVTDLKGRGTLDRLLDISDSAERTWNRVDVPAREARVAALKKLVGAGADPNAADAGGYTPLVRALKARRVDLVQALLAAGARGNTPGPEGSMAVHWLFLDDVNGYKINEDFVKETLPLLIAAGADPKAPLKWEDSNVTLRDLAARHALVDMVNFLDNARG